MNPWQNPSIELFGLRIDEPITTFTDLIVAFIGFMAFYNTRAENNSRTVTFYRYFFLFTAISTLVASFIGHAFAYYIGFEYRMIGWIFGIIGVTIAQFAVLFHAREIIGENWFKIIVAINFIELVFISIILAIYRSFAIVEVQAGFGLVIIVLIIESVYYSKTKSELSLKMIYGITLTILAVIVHVAKLVISNWFNHMDLGHILMAVALYVMYKGLQSEQKLKTIKA